MSSSAAESEVEPLQPPRAQTFTSRTAAEQHIQSWAKQRGYAVVVAKSAKKGTFVYYSCDRSGAYKNSHKLKPEDRRRATSSAKAGCPFRLRLRAIGVDEWELTILCSEHNHEASISSLAHPIQRRFNAITKDHIFECARHGMKPKRIAAKLLEMEEPVNTTPRDISNLLAVSRREQLEGRAPAEALLEWLKEQEWPHSLRTVQVGDTADKVERLESLLFAHPKGLHLLRRFTAVTVIDATYNTNQHRMPLLHFAGMTSSNKTFTIAFAFLGDETALTYTWALQALRQLEPDWTPDVIVTDDDAALGAALGLVFKDHQFAHIHCQWHVRQNVEKYARTRLPDDDEFNLFMSDFDEIRDARTLEALDEAQDNLAAQWTDKHRNLVEYVDLKLSSQHYWVAAYIDRHPHMKQRVTSRIEGAHATMKEYLHSRHGNLFNVVQQIKHHFVVQHALIDSELAADHTKVLVKMLGVVFFGQLVKNVSRFALRIIQDQDDIAQRLLAFGKETVCKCILRPTMGIPCCHQIAQWRALGLPFPLSWIHPQWRTAVGLTDVRAPRLLDPLDPKQRRIVAAATSTGRLLTGAELAHAAKKKAVRRCRNCHQTGHQCNMCPLPCGRCQSKEHSLNQCSM